MKAQLFHSVLLVVCMAVAFFAGRGSFAPNLFAPNLAAQGINPLAPALPPTTTVDVGTGTEETVLPYSEGSSGASAANGLLAVTGSYGVGTSVLYVIDTESRQLAVYEARGGSRSMRRLTLVGARRIDLDMQLRGYNDESEYPYAALEKMFSSRGGRPESPAPADPIETSVRER